MKHIAPVAAEVRQDQESEAAIVQRAKAAISTCNWKVGELASQWTGRWAKGRTDEDFGNAIGLSGDRVNQCRRVHDRFGDSDTYRKLSWSHFYAAVAWDDADACLEWACGMDATVAEMKAWRRAQHPDENLPWPPVDGDPFCEGDDDPFGEGEGAGTDTGGDGSDAEGEDDETEREGTEPAEEQPPRRRRSGTEEPAGKSQQELFAEYKAKTVKTLEAGMRAIDDANGVVKGGLPQHDKMIDALGKMILTVKGW